MIYSSEEKLVLNTYRKNLLPMIFSVLGGTVNTLIDAVFVSQVMGADGLAAVNLCLPVYLVICAVGSLISGASVVSAGLAGKEDMKEADHLYKVAVSASVLTGAVITAAGALLIDPISSFLSQDSGMMLYPLVWKYCLVTLFGAIPNCLLYTVINYLQLEGKLGAISSVMRIMVLTDVIFDFVFLVPLNMGMYGAALASVLSVGLACLYGIICLERGYSNYHIGPAVPSGEEIKNIIKAGSPIAMGNFCDAVKGIIVNTVVLIQWGPDAMTVLALLNSISEIGISITFGVPAAAGSLLAMCIPMKENGAVRTITKIQTRTGLKFSLAFSLVIIFGHSVVEKIFAVDRSIMLPAVCLGSFIVIDSLNSIFSNYMNKRDLPLYANIVVVVRRFLAPVLAILFTMAMDNYPWTFFTLAGLLTSLFILVSVSYISAVSQKKGRKLSGILLLDDRLEEEGRVLDFSLEMTEENICSSAEKLSGFCESNDVPPKVTMKLQMAIEELLMIYLKKNPEGSLQTADVRAFCISGDLGIRLKISGIQFNPLEPDEDEEDIDDIMLGVNIIKGISKTQTYTYTLGLNHLTFQFNL